MTGTSKNINEDKTEFLIAGTSRQCAKVLFDSLSVSGIIMPASPCVKNLSVVIDEKLTLNNHITYICKTYMTTSSANSNVHSVISAKSDYCNSPVFDIPDFFITKLHVQNAAAKIVLNFMKYDTYLMKLHWLPLRQRIIYKLNLIVFKVLKGDALDYIQSLLSMNQLARPLCSGDKIYKLKEP